jgi:alkanesulfonate monooxygenase SsuD/methylene tetrahydromethanopterin reductase-like flavin-dependent oxidoreductase (luciferase family)
MAEQTATLDVVSDGRIDVGIGRGYAPRENEVLGQYWGGGIQDQERNRVSFEEKVALLRQAWTEPYVSFHGEYHQVPPAHTKWHNSVDEAYLSSLEDVEVDDVIDWGEAEDAKDVYAGDSTLQSVSVYPQPVQDPHPLLWQPVTSSRSIQWAARNGINAVVSLRPHSQIQPMIDEYYEAAADAGWPDHRSQYDGEKFQYGWDETRSRGVGLYKPVFNTSVADDETLDRWSRGMEQIWYWFREFFPTGLAEALDISEAEERALRTRHELDENAPLRLDLEIMQEKNLVILGDSEEIIDQISSLKRSHGYKDFCFIALFEASSLTGQEADEQLKVFGEEVLPYLQQEFPAP